MMANNCCVIVPAIPIQVGASGGPTPVECMPQNNPVVPMQAGAFGGVAPMAPMVANNIVPSGTMPGGGGLSGFTCNANFETTQCVMEPPLQCAPTIIHHHNRVQHMVPCIKTNIHHVHNHHEWLPFEQSEMNEVVNHTHGVRPSDQQLCNSVR